MSITLNACNCIVNLTQLLDLLQLVSINIMRSVYNLYSFSASQLGSRLKCVYKLFGLGIVIVVINALLLKLDNATD